jgi:hypothetical protein
MTSVWVEADPLLLCPLCGSPRVNVSTDQPAFHRCENCTLVFQHPQPRLEDLDAYYRRGYRDISHDHLRMVNYFRATTDYRLAILSGHGTRDKGDTFHHAIPQSGKALDIGAGAGWWVRALHDRGYDATGIEPHEQYSGVTEGVERATVETYRRPSGGADLVTMFHSLEHLADPVRALLIVEGWLSGLDSRIWIEVPDLNHPLDGDVGRELIVPHLFVFSAESLARLIFTAGLELHDIWTSPCEYTRRTSLHALAGMKG